MESSVEAPRRNQSSLQKLPEAGQLKKPKEGKEQLSVQDFQVINNLIYQSREQLHELWDRTNTIVTRANGLDTHICNQYIVQRNMKKKANSKTQDSKKIVKEIPVYNNDESIDLLIR